ncbi:hypothetical protein ACHAWF_001374 [Thalassiosira exigua]
MVRTPTAVALALAAAAASATSGAASRAAFVRLPLLPPPASAAARGEGFARPPPGRSLAVPRRPPRTAAPPRAKSSEGDGAAEALREAASRLRAEAAAAEEVLRGPEAPARPAAAAAKAVAAPTEYAALEDSRWELTYRFANEPAPDDEGGEENPPALRKLFGGKVRLHFRGDGYTDALSAEGGPAAAAAGEGATFRKVWGWDVEEAEARDDDGTYLLFSADVSLPPPISTEERFYFQARVERDEARGAVSLKDGSVTVKRNLKAPGPGGGWWGIFRGADGILAQFRKVGEFVGRPIAAP